MATNTQDEFNISNVLADDFDDFDFTDEGNTTGIELDYVQEEDLPDSIVGIMMNNYANKKQKERLRYGFEQSLRGDMIPVDLGVDTYSPGIAVPYPSPTGGFTQVFNLAGDLMETVNNSNPDEIEKIRTFVYGHETPGTDMYKKSGFVSKGKGDRGGVSYGIYQYATKTGSAKAFVQRSPWAAEFQGLRPGTPEFSRKWKQLASNPETRDQFIYEQHRQNIEYFLNPIVDKVKNSTGLDINKRSTALKGVALSVATQHGPGGGSLLFRKVLRRTGTNAPDDVIIKELYNERSKVEIYFKSSKSWWSGLRGRFRREKLEALRMYYHDRRRYATK